MKKPNYIKTLEESDGKFSVMNFHVFRVDLYKFLEEKKIERVYEKSHITLDGSAVWDKIIYKTQQPFYLYIKNDSIEEPQWYLSIYYKPYQFNELIIFIRQVLKQFRDATINNN